MAILFSNSNLSTLYTHVDVVFRSTALKTRDNFLSLSVSLGFGVCGQLRREKDIKLSAVNSNQLAVTKGLREHEDNVLELIALLEETLVWTEQRIKDHNTTSDQEGSLNRAHTTKVLYQESPIMVHCIQKRNHISVKFFGEGLFDLSLTFDVRKDNDCIIFKKKIHELIDTLRTHLLDIEKINFQDLFKGVVA